MPDVKVRTSHNALADSLRVAKTRRWGHIDSMRDKGFSRIASQEGIARWGRLIAGIPLLSTAGNHVIREDRRAASQAPPQEICLQEERSRCSVGCL
jgi:hypothetical protein